MTPCEQLIAELKAEPATVAADGKFDWKGFLKQLLLLALEAWQNSNNPTP